MIKFISDDKEVNKGFVSVVTLRIMSAIEKIPDGEMRPLTWVAREARAESANGGFYLHPMVTPHRIKCNVDGRQRVWFGSVADIKAEKKRRDKEGEQDEKADS
jgi:hypothetical protein